MSEVRIIGDAKCALLGLPADSFDCVVTSPPYWPMRVYGASADEIGREETPEEWAASVASVFDGVVRVLRPEGSCWIVVGDAYARSGGVGSPGPGAKVGNTKRGDQGRCCQVPPGYKDGDLVPLGHLLSTALRNRGWYHRQTVIWNKPNAMPESHRVRPHKSCESVLMMSKRKRCYYAAPEEGLDRGVWSIPTERSGSGHPATFPTAIVRACLQRGCPSGGLVLDPFVGSGTTQRVAKEMGFSSVGIDLYPENHWKSLLESKAVV